MHAGLCLDDREFKQFRDFIHAAAGISMSPAKKQLVAGRLGKRVRHHALESFGAYLHLIGQDARERQVAVDLLTTNETHFFREPRHFDALRDKMLPRAPLGRPFRVWSAASSTGQEAYSLAMVLAEQMGRAPWEVFGSDISERVLDQARRGQYDASLTREIPAPLLRQHCLKGVGAQAGTFIIDPALRARVTFAHINLNATLPAVGEFDVIFLRNVMIYFEPATKRQVVARLLSTLRPGGWFVVGHSESLNGIAEGLTAVVPAVYRKAR